MRAVAACGSAPAALRAEYGVLGRPQRARDRTASGTVLRTVASCTKDTT